METAALHFREVQRLAPSLAYASYGLGSVYFIQQRFDLAEKELQKAVQIQPDYDAAWYMLRNAFFKNNKWTDAATYKPGQKLKLNLEVWETAKKRYGRQKLLELPDPDFKLIRLPLYWAQSTP